ncbi:MAG: UDP-N-acetylmuramoyl-L-alanyl-D-glutamate--2,6-diaminopimelate ligase, partial [Duncaniella sp.]|nr:UDP-N-acetylmuramoyl-L-alanyl-D-glutamate--2,6-diaminopimelate ligase [Duncaniella sp.]
MQLEQLLKAVKTVAREGRQDGFDATGLTADSRAVSEGMVFVAVPGVTVDGHKYISG